ncbi:hypothetical protein DMN91_001918 [Ooceraea biroi]|uniref:Uncharacterized protein n=1 Tax=Ooceraea biroi TaxID=2015173 RepID=A0A3L8E0P6_OOCBI|nr:uncharacterized protein LOC105279159 [Ooceraea biroi]RLU25759.1 hypothetical protein DMN91_001918 [Ooceraea biroi]
MEIMNITDNEHHESHAVLPVNCGILQVSCNWQVASNKQLYDAIIIVPLKHAPNHRVSYEDVVSTDTCISLQPVDPVVFNAESNMNSCTNSNMDGSNREPCMLDIKVTNCQKIARIVIVSEGSVLEIFKQSGEYETTIFTDFIDEYEGTTVFIGDTTIQPPTTEVSVKFTRTRNKDASMGIWIFGIKLFLTEAIKEAKSGAFNYDIVQTFLSNANGKPHKMADMARRVFEYYDKQETTNKEQSCQKSLESFAADLEYLAGNNKIGKRANEKDCLNYGNNYKKPNSLESQNGIVKKESENCESLNYKEDSKESNIDIRTYIDNKFYDMEKRLMKRINEMEANTNQKLDTILSKLETQLSLKYKNVSD